MQFALVAPLLLQLAVAFPQIHQLTPRQAANLIDLVVGNITQTGADTQNLNNTLNNFAPDATDIGFNAIGLLGGSTAVQNDLNNTALSANNSAPFSATDSGRVVTAVEGILPVTFDTLNNFVKHCRAFLNTSLTNAVLQQLLIQRELAREEGVAVAAKLDPAFSSTASVGISAILGVFDSAISIFSQTTCPDNPVSAVPPPTGGSTPTSVPATSTPESTVPTSTPVTPSSTPVVTPPETSTTPVVTPPVTSSTPVVTPPVTSTPEPTPTPSSTPIISSPPVISSTPCPESTPVAPVTVTAPPVTVTEPPVTVTAPPATVTEPPVTVTAPPATVTEPPVTVTAPPVTVTEPPVTVTAPAVTVTVTQPAVTITTTATAQCSAPVTPAPYQSTSAPAYQPSAYQPQPYKPQPYQPPAYTQPSYGGNKGGYGWGGKGWGFSWGW